MKATSLRSIGESHSHELHMSRIEQSLAVLDRKIDVLNFKLNALESREFMRDMESRMTWNVFFICITAISVAITIFAVLNKF